MNVSQFLAETGDVLDDPDGKEFPFAQRVRHGDRQLRGLFRTLVQSNKQYSNATLCVQKESALEPIDGLFDYRLPTWIMAVVKVWERNGTPASETTFSPYLWTSGAAQLGPEIPKSAQEREKRWTWEGSGTLRLWNFGEAPELVIECAVRPPRMVKVKLDTTPSAQGKLYLPNIPNYGEYDLEEGAYINSDWQVTETYSVTATTLGEVRRCVYSTSAQVTGGVRYKELTFDSNWATTLEQHDVVETVLSLPDEHCRLLVLQSARACLQQKGNLKVLQALQSELQEETVKFMTYATTPRDTRGPTEWQRKSKIPLRFPNRLDGRWGWY